MRGTFVTKSAGEEKQLLALQQSLFFKELGFELKEIGKIMGRSDFDTGSLCGPIARFCRRTWKGSKS